MASEREVSAGRAVRGGARKRENGVERERETEVRRRASRPGTLIRSSNDPTSSSSSS